MQLVDREHQFKLRSDRYMRYVFIASASCMTLIISSIILFVGWQGLMTFSEVSPLEFFGSTSIYMLHAFPNYMAFFWRDKQYPLCDICVL